MEPIIEAIADEAVKRYKQLPLEPPRRLIIGIAGIPGSGKSTVAYPLADRINQKLGCGSGAHSIVDLETAVAHPDEGAGQSDVVARTVGLDGWHFSKKALDHFPDPKEAHYRRVGVLLVLKQLMQQGAAFTFDVQSYADFLHSVRINHTSPIPFPEFEHDVGDPITTSQPILPQHRIIVIEGLYVLLGEGRWQPLAENLDLKVYVDIERSIARARCIRRNFAAGLSETEDLTAERVDNSDMVNGDVVKEKSIKPDIFVQCAEDPLYAK